MVAGHHGNVSNVPTRMRKASLIEKKKKKKKCLLLDIVDASEVAARRRTWVWGRSLWYIAFLHACPGLIWWVKWINKMKKKHLTIKTIKTPYTVIETACLAAAALCSEGKIHLLKPCFVKINLPRRRVLNWSLGSASRDLFTVRLCEAIALTSGGVFSESGGLRRVQRVTRNDGGVSSYHVLANKSFVWFHYVLRGERKKPLWDVLRFPPTDIQQRCKTARTLTRVFFSFFIVNNKLIAHN